MKYEVITVERTDHPRAAPKVFGPFDSIDRAMTWITIAHPEGWYIRRV